MNLFLYSVSDAGLARLRTISNLLATKTERKPDQSSSQFRNESFNRMKLAVIIFPTQPVGYAGRLYPCIRTHQLTNLLHFQLCSNKSAIEI